MIGNQYFANPYQYTITLVAWLFFIWFCKWSVYNQSDSIRELFDWNL